MNKRIFFILYLTLFATIFGLGIIGPIMPIYADSLGASGIWLGIIFASFSISRGVFMPVIGKISDERGRKRFILFGLATYFVISILYPMAGSVYSLTAVRFFHGFASAIVIPVAMAYAGEISLTGHEGQTMGTINQAMFLGMGGGPLLGGILYDLFGFSEVFYPLSIFSILTFFLILFFLPEKKGLRKAKGSVSFRKIFKNNMLLGLMIFRIINALGRGGVLSFIPIFASRSGLSASQIGLMVAAPILLMALLQSPFGVLSDRSNKFYLVLSGSVIGALALILIPLSNGFWQLMTL
ncbi:MAG: MFS transporter, partial [Deltaproteobacteria bacterium]|nr:MFS transporter [Deltaproteobacteria bacterium]